MNQTSATNMCFITGCPQHTSLKWFHTDNWTGSRHRLKPKEKSTAYRDRGEIHRILQTHINTSFCEFCAPLLDIVVSKIKWKMTFMEKWWKLSWLCLTPICLLTLYLRYIDQNKANSNWLYNRHWTPIFIILLFATF